MTVYEAIFRELRPSVVKGKNDALTAKASGLTPFSIKDTQMERVLRSSPVFYSAISVCLFLLLSPGAGIVTSSDEIS